MTERLLDDLPRSFDGWLWQAEKLIPRNELTIVVGWDGHGKTTWVLNLAAKMTRGELSGRQEKVFFSMAEDSHQITHARLKAAGADEWLCSFQPVNEDGKDADYWTLPSNLEQLEEHVQKNTIDVVILDSLDVHVDSLTSQKARQTLGLLRSMAERQNCSVILIHHFNKVGTEVDKAIGGGRGIKAAARCILVWGEKPNLYPGGVGLPQAGQDEDDPEAQARLEAARQALEDFEDATHVLAVHKNSYGLKYPYKLSTLWQAIEKQHPWDADESVLLFDKITEWTISPQQVYRPQGLVGGPPSGTQRGSAKDLILQVLSLAQDWVPADELNSIMTNAGFSQGTVRDARRELVQEELIERKKEGKTGWQWRTKPLDIPVLGEE